MEIIVADNASPDHSDQMAKELMRGWPNGRVIQHGSNLGYSEGNNRAAAQASGQYLFFLNNDTWLEPDCLERLIADAQAAGASIAAPLVMDYTPCTHEVLQSAGAAGFDVFGMMSGSTDTLKRQEVFVANGCALLVEREFFIRLGGFDPEFFMYADEYDLCWRAWVAGGKVIWAPSARLHHRSAACVNPRGIERVIENRTSDSKRFFANRNGLLLLLKNSQHLLLAILPLQLTLLSAEAVVMGALTRRWSHVRRAYLDAVEDCWRLRHHVIAERRRLRALRRHGDFWMLRFLRARLNRWDELRRLRRLGLPEVDP